jgi:heme oxygenase (biliverdin-IX-beta and delta-forming)
MDELRTLARLNAETRPHHGEADADLDRFLFRGQVTADDYRAYLARWYGFLVPLEAALAMAPGLEEVIDVRSRAKSALVVHDLLALGMSMTEVNELPQCAAIPTFRGPAAALGWMYVVERPLLASAVLRGHLATHLRAEMAYAASYLSCYAGQVGSTWRELGTAMDRVAYTASVSDRIVASANEAFRALIRYRNVELVQPTLGMRIAG